MAQPLSLLNPTDRPGRAGTLSGSAAPLDVIDLSTPRCDSACAPTRVALDEEPSAQPWGLPELRQAVAEQLDVDPAEEVLVTAGAAGALRIILDALVDRDDPVVLFDPSSPLFGLSVRRHRARLRWLWTWNEAGRLRFRPNELDRAMTGARLLLLATPKNPCGALLAAEDRDRLAWTAAKRDVLLVEDRTCAAFHYEGEAVGLGSLGHAAERTLTLGSVSKSHGLSALRVGWLAGARALVRACRVRAALAGATVATACQRVALAALRQGGPALGGLPARRRQVHEELSRLGLTPAWPAGGLSLWLPVRELGWSGRAFAEELLHQQRVQVTPGDLFGPSGVGFVRLSFAGAAEQLAAGLARLTAFLQANASRAA